MAKLVSKDGKEVKLKEGESVIKAAEELGVPFSCYSGKCTTCCVEVLEGMQNLNDQTDNEKNLDITPPCRLMCQCIIKKGTVKIKW